MSESESVKEAPALSGTVQEGQGWFANDAALQTAIAALARSRYDRLDFSLPGAGSAEPGGERGRGTA